MLSKMNAQMKLQKKKRRVLTKSYAWWKVRKITFWVHGYPESGEQKRYCRKVIGISRQYQQVQEDRGLTGTNFEGGSKLLSNPKPEKR